ncbi:MAG: bacillithiol system redox-active protein YtxJ [Flavobacteriales bacterium]
MFKGNTTIPETWHELNTTSQLDEIDTISRSIPCVIFKHSTRCSISSNAYGRLERDFWKMADNIQFFYLDLLAHRDVSNELETRYLVQHESPQILVIRDARCIGHTSHNGVNADAVLSFL